MSTYFPTSVRVRWYNKIICELFKIPVEYASDLTVTSVHSNEPDSYAFLTVELKRPLTREEFQQISELTRE